MLNLINTLSIQSNNMERIIKLSEQKLKQLKSNFKRYLFSHIDWKSNLIIITGARGTGKTTMLLQKMEIQKKESIYLSLDDFYFETNRLLLCIEELYNKGYRYFFLDEIHQYEHWSIDLKNIYDNYKDIQVIATGSSVLKIYQGQADLSRRADLYLLKGLSFREYLDLHHNIKFDTFPLEMILNKHTEISIEFTDKIDVLKYFREYLQIGYYPFSIENKYKYHQRLQQIVHLILDIDIQAVELVNYSTIRSMKKLLYLLSQMVPFMPNIQSLAEKVGTSRISILKALDLLERAQILNLLRANNQGISILQKPEKIYLENTNLAYIYSGNQPNIGNLRETFFFNQLNVGHNIIAAKYGDFFVDSQYTFEVGGVGKSTHQIDGVPLAFIVADGIEHGVQNKIPLWLFGFLY